MGGQQKDPAGHGTRKLKVVLSCCCARVAKLADARDLKAKHGISQNTELIELADA